MLLLDERQDVHLLVTNSLKKLEERQKMYMAYASKLTYDASFFAFDFQWSNPSNPIRRQSSFMYSGNNLFNWDVSWFGRWDREAAQVVQHVPEEESEYTSLQISVQVNTYTYLSARWFFPLFC